MNTKPHPLSWLGEYLPAAWPLLAVAILGGISIWRELELNQLGLAAHALVGAVVVFPVMVVAVTGIRWGRVVKLLIPAVIALAVAWKFHVPDWTATALAYAIYGVCATAFAEWARNNHSYTLEGNVLVMAGGLVRIRERRIRLADITDLATQQSWLGRLFDFGTLTPITASGFGLGSDGSFAGVAAGGRRGRFSAGIMAGGTRAVNEDRARTFHCLFGVHDFAAARRELLEEAGLLHPGGEP